MITDAKVKCPTCGNGEYRLVLFTNILDGYIARQSCACASTPDQDTAMVKMALAAAERNNVR
jgi:hypothetical protein